MSELSGSETVHWWQKSDKEMDGVNGTVSCRVNVSFLSLLGSEGLMCESFLRAMSKKQTTGGGDRGDARGCG